MLPELNYVAIVVASAISMAIGFFWYSKSGFGKQWMKLSGFNKLNKTEMKAMKEEMKKKMPVVYVSLFVLTLIMNFVLAYLIKLVGTSLASGLLMGAVVWIGFVATVMFHGVLFDRKPLKLYFINSGHLLLTLVVSGIIIAAWL